MSLPQPRWYRWCALDRGSLWAQFGAIALVLVIVGLACTFSEAVVFFPEMKAQLLVALPGGTVLYLIVAALLMALAKVLKLTDREAQQVPHRSAAAVAPLILAAGASYVLYYLVFGFAAFQFFTRKYYPHATVLRFGLCGGPRRTAMRLQNT